MLHQGTNCLLLWHMWCIVRVSVEALVLGSCAGSRALVHACLHVCRHVHRWFSQQPAWHVHVGLEEVMLI